MQTWLKTNTRLLLLRNFTNSDLNVMIGSNIGLRRCKQGVITMLSVGSLYIVMMVCITYFIFWEIYGVDIQSFKLWDVSCRHLIFEVPK